MNARSLGHAIKIRVSILVDKAELLSALGAGSETLSDSDHDDITITIHLHIKES